MKSIGIIPSRFASKRFPGKPLASIKGKTLIERVWLRAKKSALNEVVIATDDKRILKAAQAFGAKAVMTKKSCKSGTDRLAEVAGKGESSFEIFINIQGDEPLISPILIDRLKKELDKDKSVRVVTAVYPIRNLEDLENPNIVKVARDKNGFALYFSRSAVPYNRAKKKIKYFKHLGIYGYRKDFLKKFSRMPQAPLEKAEQLEQLRILENGYKIKTVVSPEDSFGVDVPKDIKIIERMIK